MALWAIGSVAACVRHGLAAALAFLVIMHPLTVSAGERLARVEMPMGKHAFERRAFDPKDMPYLMGNGEMGGLANLGGLGFDTLWFANLWDSAEARRPLQGLRLHPVGWSEADLAKACFSNRLDIANGILSTTVRFDGSGNGYDSRAFFSKSDPNLLVYAITNRSTRSSLTWRIVLAEKGFEVRSEGNRLVGTELVPGLTPVSWSLEHSVPLGAERQFTLAPGQSATFSFTVAYARTPPGPTTGARSYPKLEKQQIDAWRKQWRSIGSVILPDGDYARWFYRSLYTLYATAGSHQFLPGETQFSMPEPDWQMHAFTYGYAGWGALAFMEIGDEKHARRMLDWHYRPQELRDNVGVLFPPGPVDVVYDGKPKGRHSYFDAPNPAAMAFGHELTMNGRNITYPGSKHWDKQRSLDGFAASMFHRYSSLYPDPEYQRTVTYPVMRGTAELWRSLAKWDTRRGAFTLPPLLSVAENVMESSVLDAALAARWNLTMAARYATSMGADAELAKQWQHTADRMHVPQNDATYLEFLDDPGTRAGGGYFGIRAGMYLGYPLVESMAGLDRAKVRRTLDETWDRNNQGKGMITFISNWFALTDAYWGDGNKAYAKSALFPALLDPSGAAVCEVETFRDGKRECVNPYFLTGYASFVMAPLAMMVQSNGNEVSVFPAMPDAWRDVAFYDLPVTGGYRISAERRNGKTTEARITRDGRAIGSGGPRLKLN